MAFLAMNPLSDHRISFSVSHSLVRFSSTTLMGTFVLCIQYSKLTNVHPSDWNCAAVLALIYALSHFMADSGSTPAS